MADDLASNDPVYEDKYDSFQYSPVSLYQQAVSTRWLSIVSLVVSSMAIAIAVIYQPGLPLGELMFELIVVAGGAVLIGLVILRHNRLAKEVAGMSKVQADVAHSLELLHERTELAHILLKEMKPALTPRLEEAPPA